jgi:bacterioferritin-associated ferredoxin
VTQNKKTLAKDNTVKENVADEIMCACSGTTRGQIYDLVMQGKDFEAISRWTGVNTGCSGCEWDVAEFVKALLVQKPIE